MFNDFLHKKHIWDRNLKSIFKRYQTLAKNFENDSSGFYEFLGGPLGKWASDSPELFGNTCAAKLSYALNYSGYAIKPHTPNAYLAGDGKWYFINAKAMSNYLEKNFVSRTDLINIERVKNSITFQTGFAGGVSGHIDVYYRQIPASGHKYDLPAKLFGK